MPWLLVAVSLGAFAQPMGAPTEATAQRAEALLSRGEYQAAIKELEQARRDAATAEPQARARLAGLLGKALSLNGQQPEAIAVIEGSLKAGETSDAPTLHAALLNDLGTAKLANDDVVGAIASLDQAVDAARSVGESLLAVKAATNSASALLRRGDRVRARERSTQAAQWASSLSAESSERVLAEIALARVLADLHQVDRRKDTLAEAYTMFAHAAAIAERLEDPRLKSFAYGYLALLYESERRDAEALRLNRRAIFEAQQVSADDIAYRWHWHSARVLARQGRVGEAVPAYRRALSGFWPVRLDAMSEARRRGQSYRTAVGSLYREAAQTLIEHASASPERKTSQALLLEARDVIEQLKASELEDYFQGECVAAVRAKQRDIDQVGEKTAVIYPIILPSRLEMLVTLPDGIRRVTVPIPEQALEKEVFGLRRLLEKRTTHQYLPGAQQLYDKLLRPLESVLAEHGIETLVFVPDGALRNIPIAGLHDGRRFLVERYAVAVAPGLTLIEPRKLSARPGKTFIAGLSDSVQRFPSLPHVDQEVSDIHALRGGTVITNRQFLSAQVSQALREEEYAVVHIASHAQFDADARRSYLLTYDNRISIDELEQLLRLSRYRDQPVELLTLSACQTAAGDDRSALGLAGVAVKAGARSALATLWYVNDAAASHLATNFYRELGGGAASKVKALQAAQRQMLSERRFRHPGYWAPFLLIGSWL